MIYPDASVLVAAVTDEEMTDAAVRLLATAPAGALLASNWTVAEVASALAIKARNRSITAQARVAAMQLIRRTVADTFVLASVTDRHLTLATDFIERDLAPLKASDALHLAIASISGATIWTSDCPMITAAEALGVTVARL